MKKLFILLLLAGTVQAQINVRSSAAGGAATSDPGQSALKNFLTKTVNNAATSRINVFGVGTSILYGDVSAGAYIGRGIAALYGASKSQYVTPTNYPANGFKTQYYSGPFSYRFRGLVSEGATTNTFGTPGGGAGVSSITLYYDTEPDGGTANVSTLSGGTTTVQTPISCSGVTSFGKSVTYTFDPTQSAAIAVTPTGTGATYLSAILFNYGDNGVMWSNTAYGGSSLANHAGTTQRVAGSGMAPTATPSGSLGLTATFAPTDPLIKHDLVIYSGWTNDGADVSFPANLSAAVTSVVSSSASIILIVEPINAQSNYTAFMTQRAAMYALQAQFPDNVLVYDMDLFESPTGQPGVFAPNFHSTDVNDPHPQSRGFGDPHALAGADALKKLGVPFPPTQDRTKALSVYDPRTAVSSTNPRFTGTVGIGAGTINTANALHVTTGNVQLGTQNFGDVNLTQYGSFNLLAGGGGFGSFNVYSSNATSASAFELGNTGTGGKRYQFVVGGNNNGGGGGTAPSEGSLIIKRQPDDAAVLFLTKSGNLGLNTYPPNPAAILQADATDRGFLPPRMSTTQRNAITSPPEGLQVYNTTTHALEYWNGTVWKTVTTN